MSTYQKEHSVHITMQTTHQLYRVSFVNGWIECEIIDVVRVLHFAISHDARVSCTPTSSMSWHIDLYAFIIVCNMMSTDTYTTLTLFVEQIERKRDIDPLPTSPLPQVQCAHHAELHSW
jgi:hypothetical protein